MHFICFSMIIFSPILNAKLSIHVLIISLCRVLRFHSFLNGCIYIIKIYKEMCTLFVFLWSYLTQFINKKIKPVTIMTFSKRKINLIKARSQRSLNRKSTGPRNITEILPPVKPKDGPPIAQKRASISPSVFHPPEFKKRRWKKKSPEERKMLFESEQRRKITLLEKKWRAVFCKSCVLLQSEFKQHLWRRWRQYTVDRYWQKELLLSITKDHLCSYWIWKYV